MNGSHTIGSSERNEHHASLNSSQSQLIYAACAHKYKIGYQAGARAVCVLWPFSTAGSETERLHTLLKGPSVVAFLLPAEKYVHSIQLYVEKLNSMITVLY